MKTYMTPDVFVTEFQANVAVAECSRIEAGEEHKYEPQTITCVVAGSEVIFGNGITGCDTAVDMTSDQLVYFEGNENYDAGYYYVWYDGEVDGRPTTEQQNMLAALGISGAGWHGGPATETIIKLYSHS